MPQLPDIAVESTTVEVDRFNPLSAYAALAAEFGHGRVGMLESVVGSGAAARVSHILVDPILTLTVSGRSVTFSGDDGVVEVTVARCEAGGFACAQNVVTLEERTGLWDLLRQVQSTFTVQGEDRSEEFEFGFFAYLGYDVAWSIEDLPINIERSDEVPVAVFTIHSAHARTEVATGRTSLTLHRAPGWFDVPDKTRILEALTRPLDGVAEAPEIAAPSEVEETIRKSVYLANVRRAQEHIGAGDIYQVQVGHELRVHSEAKPFDVYRRLRARNPSPYMYLATFDDFTVAGASPEVCVLVVGDHVTVRPIAGTVRRGATNEEDQALVAQMLADEKEVAEHVMLVDLGRNDVGRVSVPKSLGVDELMVIEQYSHVSHMVSNVVGTLRPDADSYDAIASTFPAGTVTGAPKVRAMEIIESLENTQRGAYAGAVGLIDFRGYTITCLGLRSTSHRNGMFRLRASAGIVADSKPESEWAETLAKMAAPFWATTGGEIADARLGG